MNNQLLEGYTIEEIDDVAKEIIQTICETGTSQTLARLALCRSIVMVSTQDVLDLACRVIDEFAEVPFDKIDYIEDL